MCPSELGACVVLFPNNPARARAAAATGALRLRRRRQQTLRPELRPEAEAAARRLLGDASIEAVAESVAWALEQLPAPEVAVIYAEDPDRLASAGRLLPATRGVNVVVAEPYDPIVFERMVSSGADTYASTAQVALDCLTGNGRMPAEGEAVLAWMRKNESRWRVASLETVAQDTERVMAEQPLRIKYVEARRPP